MTFEEFIEEEKERDPEFRRVWEEGEPEFQVIRMLVRTRSQRGWTQKELARRMGTDQPSISRAETTGQVTPAFLARFAAAAGGTATLSVKVPGQRRLSLVLGGVGDAKLPPLEKTMTAAVHGRVRRQSFRFRVTQGSQKQPASQPGAPDPARARAAPGAKAAPAVH